MAAVPIVINGVMFPKGKAAGDKPVPCTVVGYAYDPTLSIGGGPIEPPPDIPVEPPLVIWGGGNEPFPTPPIFLPPVGPPDEIPQPPPAPPHEGWNWSFAKNQWYYLYVPDPGQAQPKRPR